ncbi:carbohydrate ABC transporter permease [Halanaerobacter jeridensis]|uniref:ABC-type glycerol-3-phosphate transport system permease component n=1 Tax=Halanaerobacter jeridensis TaxID=706427 RepID=A0A938XUP4_9FIRM|nr:carbohydrate ABC transporter permease [Halanaerobacter jeridensis]MBM7556661.1 ABC-type glycerol-3-phosphate transport system permease component [Halanaerobacter jeridensis]
MSDRKILIGKYIALIMFLLFIITPFMWILYSSFRTEASLFSGQFFAGGLTLKHYSNVLGAGQTGQFKTYFLNSFIIASISTVVVVILSLLGAYALSRFKMKFKDGIILSLLSANMFPRVLLLIPLFGVLFDLQLIDSYIGIIITHIILGLPFGLWLVKGYFDSVPKELDEAAKIDGLGPIGILFKIIVPITAPGMVVAGFYAFMVSWGDYLFSSVISQSLSTQTLPIGLNKFFGSSQIQWGSINAAVVITIIPTIILFSVLQKWIVEGLASGAVKG